MPRSSSQIVKTYIKLSDQCESNDLMKKRKRTCSSHTEISAFFIVKA